ncbi:thymidylate synthase [Candidatus Wolfebacteria bacterium]|nr:thymidylate synthase [Candidatus Wolfebacteria bacterium]
MRQYLDSLHRIMESGVDREGRNGYTRVLWVEQLRFNLQHGFPAVTTKKLAFNQVVAELLWFLKGPTREGRMDDTALQELVGKNETIWTANAKADYWANRSRFPGDLGRIYGAQWRDWRRPDGTSFDQFAWAINELQTNPYNRRIMVTAFNPGETEEMALPPCHVFFHFFVAKGRLSMHMVQRSCDMFHGVPFNIASYALLLSMVAQVVNMEPHQFVISLDDAHIYHPHFKAVREQLTREPMPLPQLWLNPTINDINKFGISDIRLEGYQHHPAIKAPFQV